jgi:hypothetical protein
MPRVKITGMQVLAVSGHHGATYSNRRLFPFESLAKMIDVKFSDASISLLVNLYISQLPS